MNYEDLRILTGIIPIDNMEKLFDIRKEEIETNTGELSSKEKVESTLKSFGLFFNRTGYEDYHLEKKYKFGKK
ncbi:MAG: hypothetical protein KIT33_12535 [Candidatus Kapabacteria bacterium]|nr:hypothetical protein [Ignavibacteriota bacterium]MCW5885787.1 hypothetical protein [Candidatus Kapabacteria bacterium]